MAGEAGRLSRLYTSTDGGTTFLLVGCINDMSVDKALSLIDTTCHEDGQDTTAIAGKRTRTITANYNYLEDDVGQSEIRSVYDGTGEGLKLRWRHKVEVGRQEFEADVIVTGVNEGMPNDDKATEDATFQVTGAVTESTQV
jgi:hypothetical protein